MPPWTPEEELAAEEAAMKSAERAARRDLFAAAALTGILSRIGLFPEEAARIAFSHANAMLAQLDADE